MRVCDKDTLHQVSLKSIVATRAQTSTPISHDSNILEFHWFMILYCTSQKS